MTGFDPSKKQFIVFGGGSIPDKIKLDTKIRKKFSLEETIRDEKERGEYKKLQQQGPNSESLQTILLENFGLLLTLK